MQEYKPVSNLVLKTVKGVFGDSQEPIQENLQQTPENEYI